MDGAKLDLVANIEMPLEVDIALHNGARGIGLYRTEFYISKKGFLRQLKRCTEITAMLQKDGALFRYYKNNRSGSG